MNGGVFSQNWTIARTPSISSLQQLQAKAKAKSKSPTSVV
jgi:hypothetical protein